MKNMMKTVRPTRSKAYLKQKLISAGAMLLVSAILMVSTSYAWYVLSTAPEVTNIKTQVGANGALEIALLDTESWSDLDRLDMGDIDESLEDQTQVAAAVSNLTWGNLVNLDDSSYGLDKIILQPARLAIMADGEGYKINTTPLRVPVYGEDGRVKELDKTSAVAYTYADGGFTVKDSYGVRAIGTVADMGVYQQGMNTARSNLVTYASAARTAASTTLKAYGGGLATIVVDYAVNKVSEFDDGDVASIKVLAMGLQDALEEIETAMRYVFAGYLTTSYAEKEGVTSDNYQEKLAEVTGDSKTLEQLLEMYPGIKTLMPSDANNGLDDGIKEFIEKLAENQSAVKGAIDSCNGMSGGTYNWEQLSSIIRPLVETDEMTVAGKSISELQEMMSTGGLDELISSVLGSGGLTVTVPSGSGVLSEIADFAGDYSAEVKVEEVTYDGRTLTDQKAMMSTQTQYDPIHLTDCSNSLRSAELADDSDTNAGITDFYGYALDLAFRTNAEDSSLMLQTEPENRIYEGTTQNAALQGGGSYMSFTTSAGLSATKMVKLMSGIRVVFAVPLENGTMEVLAIAALDTTLGVGDYTVLATSEQESTGMYAYMNRGVGDYQNSDLITEAEYKKLAEESSVTFDENGKVTAKLYIQNFEMAKRYLTDEDGNYILDDKDEKTFAYTGALTLNGKADSAEITELLSDVVKKVTVLVYLDGSVVNNSMVAAESAQSMAGTLNLQFSSSANLVPATVTKLQSETWAEPTDDVYKAGYLEFAGILGKVKSGYTIYTDGSGNYCYAVGDSSQLNELTTANYTNALTPVTATLSANAVELAVGETANLTVTLSDTSLPVIGGGYSCNTSCLEVDADSSYYNYTLTGTAAGISYFEAYLTVSVESKEYKIETSRITVTVTEESSDGQDSNGEDTGDETSGNEGSGDQSSGGSTTEGET